MRLQASVLSGKLKRRPIWTAFVTNQIRVPGWASWDSKKVVLLADLEQFIFINHYSPQRTSTGGFELTFIERRGITLVILVVLVRMLIGLDAEDFMNTIQALIKNTQTVDVKQKM